MKKVVIIFLLIALLMISYNGANISAQSDLIDSGNHGVNWSVTSMGVLNLEGGVLDSPVKSSGYYEKIYPWESYKKTIRKIIIHGDLILPETPYLFYKFPKLEIIENLYNVNTTNVTDFSLMFASSPNIKELDINSWDTSNAKTMDLMFRGATNLQRIEFASWNTTKLLNMNEMFRGTTQLRQVDFNKWDVSNVETMVHTFSETPNLTFFDLSQWDVSSVKSMSYMFYSSGKRDVMDLSNWDVQNVTNISGMFKKMSFEEIDLSNWKTTNLEVMDNLLSDVNGLKDVNLSNWDVKRVKSMENVFQIYGSGLSEFDIINLSNWKLTGLTNLSNLFRNYNYQSDISSSILDLSGWNNEMIFDFNFLDNMSAYTKLDISGWKDVNIEKTLNKFITRDFFGIADIPFEIVGLDFKILDMASVSFDPIPSVKYNGESHTPSLILKDGDHILELDTDYEVRYDENINGKYGSVFVRGLPNYQNRTKYINSKSISFIIEPLKVKYKDKPIASTVHKGDSLSNSKIQGGLVIDENGDFVEVVYSWDYNNIDQSRLLTSGYYPIIITSKEYKDEYNYDFESLKLNLYVRVDEIKDGWLKRNDNWYYYVDGHEVTGWLRGGGENWFYLNNIGIMQIGWNRINNNWYYFNTSGYMQKNWNLINGEWYYLNNNGAMQTGWKSINGSWYFFNSSGAMETGWNSISNKWYYFNPSGRMEVGWKLINNYWYHMDSGGAMQTGWKLIRGEWYYFNSGGIMQKGWNRVGGQWYYLNSSGIMLSNTRVDGYYLGSNGVMR